MTETHHRIPEDTDPGTIERVRRLLEQRESPDPRLDQEAAHQLGLYELWTVGDEPPRWLLPESDVLALLDGHVDSVPAGGSVEAIRQLSPNTKDLLLRLDVPPPGIPAQEVDPHTAGGPGFTRPMTLEAFRDLEKVGAGLLEVRAVSEGGTRFVWRLHPTSVARVAHGELDEVETWQQVKYTDGP